MNIRPNLRDTYELHNELYKSLGGKASGEAFDHITQHITNQQSLSQNLPFDEPTLINKISSHLSMYKSQSDAVTFMNYYELLSTCTDLRNRNAILTFLLFMADSNKSTNAYVGQAKKPFSLHLNNDASSSIGSSINLLKIAQQSSASSTSNHFNQTKSNLERLYPSIGMNNPSSISLASSENLLKVAQFKPTSQTSLSGDSSQGTDENRNSLVVELTEELVQDVIYSFTGIQGKYLKKDIISGGFKLSPKSRTLNITHAGMLLRLGELGYYHDQVESFTDPKSGRSPLGLLGQGLITALKTELTQYYGMVAVLQEQLNVHRKSCEKNPGEKLTLMKVLIWAAEPLHRLQWLATIADTCQEKKGGALATAVSSYQHNGDPGVKALVHELLLAVCGPLQYMLSKWLLEGEIYDPHSEFFIEILPEVGPDRLWSDKYRVREAMLPSFISKELANKILVTGKSINFLREVCQDKTPIKGKEDLKQCFETNHDNLFSAVPDSKLHMLIDTVYLNTSKKVLDIVMGPHKLLQHLQAMRNYLLLGQGDFIEILIQNLKPELDRPAKDLYSYELSSILDAAIRSTNAQYDDPEILSQLDVRLMGNFEGDLGWDIFVLLYTVRGPLATMLEPSMSKYQLMFKPLWHMKHLQLLLTSKIWKEQISNAKLLRTMKKELNPITYRLHLYSSQMIHFIHQMQYYILFEVIECLWTNMLDKVRQAKALDDILEAHEEFLRDAKIGVFLDDNGTIYGRLTNVFSAIAKLEAWQDKFFDICFKEFNARKEMQEQIVASENKGKYGVTAEKRFERDEENKLFVSSLMNCQKSLEKIGSDYEISVRQFLLLLASSTDHNLQLFGTRLDFNEYYKKRDQRLDAPLTFAIMRHSSMLHQNNKSSSKPNRLTNNYN